MSCLGCVAMEYTLAISRIINDGFFKLQEVCYVFPRLQENLHCGHFYHFNNHQPNYPFDNSCVEKIASKESDAQLQDFVEKVFLKDQVQRIFGSGKNYTLK